MALAPGHQLINKFTLPKPAPQSVKPSHKQTTAGLSTDPITRQTLRLKRSPVAELLSPAKTLKLCGSEAG